MSKAAKQQQQQTAKSVVQLSGDAQFYVLRHGVSVANERKIICSSMANGCAADMGLSEAGKKTLIEQQAPAVVAQLLAVAAAAASKDAKIVFVSSPFTRALETAHVCLQQLQAAAAEKKLAVQATLRVEDRLRERDFGKLELRSDSNYDKVWAEDAAGSDEQSTYGAESLGGVWSRVAAVLGELEQGAKALAGKEPAAQVVFVLVAHGDVLQITQAGLQALELKAHRSLPHLNQAELRRVA